MSVNENEFTVKWKIENFSMLPHQKGNCFSSPEFVIDAWENIKWCLELYPRGDNNDESQGYVSVYFIIRHPKDIEMKVDYTLALESIETSSEKSFTDTRKVDGDGWGYSQFISLKELKVKNHLYLPQDILTIRFHLKDATETSTEIISIRKARTFRSGIQAHQRSITWPIQRIGTLKGCIETSLSEFLDDSPGLKLCLILIENPHYCTFLIDIQQTGPPPLVEKQERLFVKCEITVNTSDKTYQDSKKSTHLFQLDTDDIWHFPKFIKTTHLSREQCCKTDHILYLQFEFTFSYKNALYHWNTNYTPVSFGLSEKPGWPSKWCTIMQNAFATGEFTDVELRAGGEAFQSYKVVLCTRSSIFRAMFQNDMKEKNSGIVEIDDLEPATLRRMLAFLYSDILDSDMSPEDACNLYRAADKYDIPLMKNKCSIWLVSSLSVGSACDVLVLADVHQDDFLMTAVRNFACFYSIDIFNSVQWNNIMEVHVKLAAKFMHDILKEQELA